MTDKPYEIAPSKWHLIGVDYLALKAPNPGFIAMVTVETDRALAALAEQQARALEYLTKPIVPLQFKPDPPAEDGFEIRARYWSMTTPTYRATFLVGDIGPALDPLDAEIDGVELRDLLVRDQRVRREGISWRLAAESLTTAQRAAVSAHWSAELRAKVAASAERDRNQVRVDLQDEP